MKQICSIGVCADDHLLMGIRRDNRRFTLPGGHKNDGETIHDGARRELFEEAGLRPELLSYLGSDFVTTFTGKRIEVHSFRADLPTLMATSLSRDPDQEVYGWYWYPTSQGLPKHVVEGLHSPRNTTLRRMGLLVY